MATYGNILVIEDDAALSDFILEALGEEGYSVRIVLDAAQAHAALDTHMPDLILCDLRMPGLPGRGQLVQLQQTLSTAVPIVVMAADRQTAHHLDDLNIAFCLIKPFDLDALLACVATHIHVPC